MSLLTKQIKMPRLQSVRPQKFPKPSLPKPSLSKLSLSKTPNGRADDRAGAVTGLEIGATQAIAAQGRARDGRVVAERVAVRALPHGLVRDGIVRDSERLAVELKALFAEHRLPRRVRVGLATPRTVLRVVDLPPLDERDIQPALLSQAQDRIPMPLDRAVMDFQPVGLIDTPEGSRMRVIVVATESEGVRPLVESVRGAGLKLEGIDLSIFAAIRALSAEAQAARPTLFAQLGDLVTIGISESGMCRFMRQAPQGLALVLDRIAEARAVSIDEARALLTGLAAQSPDAEPIEDVRDVFTLLARIAAELGSELRTAAEFYSTQAGTAITHGVVSGPLAPVPGFVATLADASGLELISGEATAAGPDALAGVDARVAPVAAGLTVGKVHA